MQQNNSTKALVFFVVIILLGFGVYYFTSDHSHTEPPSNSQQVPTSYEHFDSLIDYGLSSPQLALAEQSTADFVKSKSSSAKTVSVDTSTIQQTRKDPNSEINILSYNFSVDNVTYRARLNYIGLNAVELYVDNQSGTQMYDSGLKQ